MAEASTADSPSRRLSVLATVAGLLLLIVVAVQVWRFLRWPTGPSPEELAATARHGATADIRQRAAVKLSDAGDGALTYLRTLAKEAEDPAVRASCVNGLGTLRDFDSVEFVLAAHADASPLVRTRAKHALGVLWSREIYFPLNGSTPERERALKQLEAQWQRLQRWGVVETIRQGGALAYFYDPKTEELFEGPVEDENAFSPRGWRAAVFCCGEAGPYEERYVGYLFSTAGELKSKGLLPAGKNLHDDTEFVSPPRGNDWHEIESHEGKAIMSRGTSRCTKHGKPAVSCYPEN